MFVSEETVTQQIENKQEKKTKPALEYQGWTPELGDFKKYNAADDKEKFEKRLRKDKRRKILLAVINIAVIAGSLIYFL